MQELHWMEGSYSVGSPKRISYHPCVASFEDLLGHNGRSVVIPQKTILLSLGYSLWTWIESDLTLGWRRE